MKIDLHVHSSERSTCGKADEEEQIKAAIAAGLDAIVFTDHGKLVPEVRLRQLNQIFSPFRIFNGIEISLEEDILIIGVQDHELEVSQWTYPELHTYVRGQGGYLILAHPYRYHPTLDVDIEQYTPDGIEIYSMNTPTAWQPRILELSRQLNLTLLSNSDAHKTDSIGVYYNEIPGSPESHFELVNTLKRGPVLINS